MKLIPKWCEAIDSGDLELKVHILEQFLRLVCVVKQHMRRFLEQIMKMLEHLWVPSCSKKLLLSMLRLIAALAGRQPVFWGQNLLSEMLHFDQLVSTTCSRCPCEQQWCCTLPLVTPILLKGMVSDAS